MPAPFLVKNLFGAEVPRTLRKGEQGVGCAYCPLDKAPNTNKVKGLVRINQRKAFLWGSYPGKQDNLEKIEFVGKAGRLLWETASLFGLKRSDFDIQNVLRCAVGGDPTKEELRCCSIFNEEALELNNEKAVVHCILGEVAGKQLLKKAYRKDTPIFWHKPWNAYVVINNHPSFVLRLGGKEAGGAYLTFRDRFRAVKASLRNPGRWGYVLAKERNYGAVSTPEELELLINTLYAEASNGRRVSVDLEDGEVNGKRVPLMFGFGWGHFETKDPSSWVGGARSVILEHPENKEFGRYGKRIKERLAQILSDSRLQKVFQHGSYDEKPIKDYFGVNLRGYKYDTQYAAFLKDSNLRKYSLDNLIKLWFPEFQDYKTTLVSEWNSNFALAPLNLLVTYNCADCDVTKRIEEKIGSTVSLPLLETYIHDAFVLDGMEGRGPFLDWPEHARLEKAVDEMIQPIEQQLKILAEDDEFNPGSPPQVAKLLFTKLGLVNDEKAGKSTKEEWLELLYKKTNHPAPKLMLRWRALAVIKNTFLPGYAKSATTNKGELHTIWWLTGAATGRLRSGKSGEAEREGIINMQNTHGHKLLQNLIVSDPNWRLAI